MSAPKARASRGAGRKFERVPLLDLQRQYQAIGEEVLAEIGRVCASQQFILGSEVERLESEVGAFTGAAEAVGCASGTDALWLSLLAAGVQPGDVVVTTAFSFFASASSIVRAGARPMLMDIDPQMLNLDAGRVAEKLRSGRLRNLGALLPVHLYGQCADMDALGSLGEEFRVPIIEDAAQAIGAKWRERGAGSLGTAGAFSFYPSKNLSAYGDAGLMTTNDAEIAERMRRLSNHGSSRRYHHEELGWNCRMDSIQAAVLSVKLRYVEQWNTQRRQHAELYDRLFVETGLAARRGEGTSDSSGGFPVRLLRTDARAQHVFHQYVIRAHRRDELREFLMARGIGTEI